MANVEDLRSKVEQAITKIRPYLRRDGGDIELVDVGADGVVKVKLTGACFGCPYSQITLQAGVERVIKQEVPEVTKVESVS